MGRMDAGAEPSTIELLNAKKLTRRADKQGAGGAPWANNSLD